MTRDFSNRHQIILGIEMSTDLPSVLEEGRELTDMTFDPEENEAARDLVRITQDVHVDLENGNVDAAKDKLKWYFTNGQFAQAEDEDEVYSLLGEGLSGAIEVNEASKETLATQHLGLLSLYRKLTEYTAPKKQTLPSTNTRMYRK
jgi:hypothetical protein